jgi:hypothetical protein
MRLTTVVTIFIATLLSLSGCSGSSYVPPTPPSEPPGTSGFSISTISPASVSAGSSDLTVTITGTDLDLVHSGSHQTSTVAVWSENGVDTNLSNANVNSSTELTAVVSAAQLAVPTTATISVQKWYFADDTPFAVTNSIAFKVTSAQAAGEFAPAGDMLAARSGHSAALLPNGNVLIVGGGTPTAELFNPATKTFQFTGSLLQDRFYPSVTLLSDGRVLIAGGYGTTADSSGKLPILDTAEIYDPATGSFNSTGHMLQARVLHAAAVLTDARVLIAGGMRDGGGGGAAIATGELYDPANGMFSPTAGMATDRAQLTATLLASGKVLIAGGWNGHRADAADDPPWDPLFAELYDPASQTFHSIASMSTTRIGHQALRLADGKVLMLGGVPSIQNVHEEPPDPQYAEVFDAGAQTFSSVPALTLSQHGYTATLLPSGLVLIAGGDDTDNVPIAFAVLVDPMTGNFAPTGNLAHARIGHAAVLLKSGQVLITGGTDNNGNVLASAEIFQ